MAWIKLQIKKCTECPYVKEEHIYTSDSWEHVFSYSCGLSKKEIADWVEYEKEMPLVPYWCPIRTD